MPLLVKTNMTPTSIALVVVRVPALAAGLGGGTTVTGDGGRDWPAFKITAVVGNGTFAMRRNWDALISVIGQDLQAISASIYSGCL